MGRTRRPHPNPTPVFDEPVFGEGVAAPDPTRFSTRHPSDQATYNALGDTLQHDVVDVPPARGGPADLYKLETAYGSHGPAVVQAIAGQGRVVFHAVGDTGASDVRRYRNEIRVFDQIADDCHTSSPPDRPAFLFHLGDVIYDFGEARYYFDQFYDPNRNYPGPIFAIPGNHDSFVVPGTPAAADPLVTFARNFCAEHPTITPEAGSLHRTAGTQPGVYFALDCPFVRVIGLFSNALEDPGLVSGEGGRWPGVSDRQLEFLAAQLRQVRDEKYSGAVLLATHHPPFAYAPPGPTGAPGTHSSSTDMLRDIDTVCKDAGVYPHAVLSAHVHNYQRYTRTVKLGGRDMDVPFVVCGSGGHNINRLVRPTRGEPATEPAYGSSADHLEAKPAVGTGGLILEKYEDRNYGYLRIAVDNQTLKIGFHVAGNGLLTQSRFDQVTVDLAGRTLVAN